jgi:hypothetical protein
MFCIYRRKCIQKRKCGINARFTTRSIEYVIVDIGLTKKFPVDPFTAYVALSQSWGQDMIWPLRDFNDVIFTKHPFEDQCVEDERLKLLDGTIKEI